MAEAAAVRQRLADNPIWQASCSICLRCIGHAVLGCAVLHTHACKLHTECTAVIHAPASCLPIPMQAEQGSGDPSQLDALRKKSELIQVRYALTILSGHEQCARVVGEQPPRWHTAFRAVVFRFNKS